MTKNASGDGVRATFVVVTIDPKVVPVGYVCFQIVESVEAFELELVTKWPEFMPQIVLCGENLAILGVILVIRFVEKQPVGKYNHVQLFTLPEANQKLIDWLARPEKEKTDKKSEG